jgi:hypothetical protein
MVRQITISEFPASWQEKRSEERAHDSRVYGTRFMLRLDEPSQIKLQQLVQQFGSSKAKIIRHLIAQAEPEDFPPSWHMRAAERRAQQIKEKGIGNVPNMAPTASVGEVDESSLLGYTSNSSSCAVRVIEADVVSARGGEP